MRSKRNECYCVCKKGKKIQSRAPRCSQNSTRTNWDGNSIRGLSSLFTSCDRVCFNGKGMVHVQESFRQTRATTSVWIFLRQQNKDLKSVKSKYAITCYQTLLYILYTNIYIYVCIYTTYTYIQTKVYVCITLMHSSHGDAANGSRL